MVVVVNIINNVCVCVISLLVHSLLFFAWCKGQVGPDVMLPSFPSSPCPNQPCTPSVCCKCCFFLSLSLEEWQTSDVVVEAVAGLVEGVLALVLVLLKEGRVVHGRDDDVLLALGLELGPRVAEPRGLGRFAPERGRQDDLEAAPARRCRLQVQCALAPRCPEALDRGARAVAARAERAALRWCPAARGRGDPGAGGHGRGCARRRGHCVARSVRDGVEPWHHERCRRGRPRRCEQQQRRRDEGARRLGRRERRQRRVQECCECGCCCTCWCWRWCSVRGCFGGRGCGWSACLGFRGRGRGSRGGIRSCGAGRWKGCVARGEHHCIHWGEERVRRYAQVGFQHHSSSAFVALSSVPKKGYFRHTKEKVNGEKTKTQHEEREKKQGEKNGNRKE